VAGQVLVDNQVVDKAGALVPDSAQVELKGGDLPFVSRGGLKLAKAIKEFGIDLRGRKVLDIGASTGGFTDCCLQAGAALVYAVDVGYGQLAWSLRTNPAVVNLERTNVRYLSREQLTRGLPDFACIDVSFISLRLVLPVGSRPAGSRWAKGEWSGMPKFTARCWPGFWPKPKNWALSCGISIFPRCRVPTATSNTWPTDSFAVRHGNLRRPLPSIRSKKPMSILRKTGNPGFLQCRKLTHGVEVYREMEG